MTTVSVVKKARDVAIAADTLVTFGNTRLSARLEASSTLLKMQGAGSFRVVGRASTVALAGLTANCEFDKNSGASPKFSPLN